MTLGYLQSVGIISHTLQHFTDSNIVIITLYLDDNKQYKKTYNMFISYSYHTEDCINCFLEEKNKKNGIVG